jgi:hypothetical protein
MRSLLVACLLALAAGRSLVAQRDSVLAHRWVGLHLRDPLVFEFYGDTMLVVNDEHVLNFRLTNDSLSATGDTSVAGRYRLVLGRLIFEASDDVVTMAMQSPLARPLTGRWSGPLGTEDGALAELTIFASGTARWRGLPTGRWADGEWDRETRLITFTWADSTEWRGQYDPVGNAILFEQTVAGAGTTILRRVFR